MGHLCHAAPLQNPKYASDINMPSQTKWRNVGWKPLTVFYSTFTNVFLFFLSRFLRFLTFFIFFLERFFFTSMAATETSAGVRRDGSVSVAVRSSESLSKFTAAAAAQRSQCQQWRLRRCRWPVRPGAAASLKWRRRRHAPAAEPVSIAARRRQRREHDEFTSSVVAVATLPPTSFFHRLAPEGRLPDEGLAS